MRGVTALVWFRRDLRLADNSALRAALAACARVVPVFVWDPAALEPWAPGAAARWWLQRSLQALAADLERCGSRLVLRRGRTSEELKALAAETGATALYCARRYEPAARALDAEVADALHDAGVSVKTLPGALLHDPDRLCTDAGEPYRVFTPFWRRALEVLDPPRPPPAPARLPAVPEAVRSLPLEALGLMPTRDWYREFESRWTPGEAGAHRRLESFAEAGLHAYAWLRDRTDRPGSSRLSPHLAWGEVSPRQLWWTARQAEAGAGGESFLREVGWREFSYHLLWHNPRSPEMPLDPRFERFEWRDDPQGLRRWQRGRTGIPLVDAGMRELWRSGWLHNRARMIVASFLTKNLLIPWQTGARWFWDTLVDADLANNTQGWQWTAGCGADAAPFFRIFNPVRQAAKADPEGGYVREFVPELARLPDEYLQRPWEAPANVLAQSGVRLGHDYPLPLADLLATRRRALERFERIKRGGARR